MIAFLLALALLMPRAPAEVIHKLSAQVPRLTGYERIVVLGEPTCGKSTIAEALALRSERALFFDCGGDDYTAPGRLVLSPAELARHPSFLDDPHARIVVVPEGGDARELSAELDTVLTTVGLWRKPAPIRDMAIVLDEVGDYRAASEGLLNKLFRWSRHMKVSAILVSQVATDIPKTCRRIASHAVCVGQSHPDDLDALAEVYKQPYADSVALWRKYDPPVVWSRTAQLERRNEAEPIPEGEVS